MVSCDVFVSLLVVRVHLSFPRIPRIDPIESPSALWSVPNVCLNLYYRPVCSAESIGGQMGILTPGSIIIEVTKRIFIIQIFFYF